MPREDSASRVISAAREDVYAALVNPEALLDWLTPAGMTGDFERFDARPGGSYRLVLTYTDSSTARGKTTTGTDVVESRFVELVPGMQVVQAVASTSRLATSPTGSPPRTTPQASPPRSRSSRTISRDSPPGP